MPYKDESVRRAKQAEYNRRYFSSEKGRAANKYGTTREALVLMVERQGNVCAICRTPFTGTSWHVDHDHVTGRIRGLLCQSCNLGVGHFKDDPDRLRGAASYLEAHGNPVQP